MSQGDDGAGGSTNGGGGGGGPGPGGGGSVSRRASTTGNSNNNSNSNGNGSVNGTGNLMGLIRERQGAAGSTQILDLSYANLDTFPTEIEFLRDVLEKLTMSHNSIRTLPLQLNMFTSLRYLNIRANSIRIFPAVLCHLSSLEILDMSRNKITRFPDVFGNLMNLRVLSISRNRIEIIPTYIGDMGQLQFLKIEQNPITFPPPEIVDFPGQDMEGWLNRLKVFLVTHKRDRNIQSVRIPIEEAGVPVAQEGAHLIQQRGNRSASLDSLVIPPTNHRQSKSEAGLRLSIPNAVERTGHHSNNLSPDPISQKLARTSSQHGSHGDDHYRFISHSRGVSGDSTSSFGSSTSNDCDRYSEVYFQRLAAYPPPPQPLPGERMRLVEAARGILFALSQIYRAVKQVVGCSTDEKFTLMFTRLLQSANSAMAQLIQSLDRFDSSAQVQVPDQTICAEIMRCCESNVVAFRKLVHMVQAQIRSISIVADARLVRNLVLMLHGALSEIRVAWDSLLPLLQGPGEVSVEILESSHHLVKEEQLQQQVPQTVTINAIGQVQGHHQQQGHFLSANLTTSHQPHPFQLSPTMPTSSTWLPVQIPQRSHNMSRTSNHSSQSTSNLHHDEEEDAQLLLTVEHAIEAARRVIQCLTETCMNRVENLLASPQQRPTHRARSVSASPPRSIGSNGSSSGHLSSKSASQDQQNRALSMSPLQLAADTSSSTASHPSSATASTTNPNGSYANGDSGKPESGLIRSPLFSPTSDTVPYSNGMCVALPIDHSFNNQTESGTAASSSYTGPGEEGGTKHERRLGSHSKGSSKASFDPALPSIPQDEVQEVSSQDPTSAATTTSTPQYQPVMTARSFSVSGLPSNSHYPLSLGSSSMVAASSLPSQGFVGGNSVHPHMHSGYPQPPTPGLYSSAAGSFPFPAGGVTPLPASQLWCEMKDCLLQMTEIVKRLDLDLTMIRTDDHYHHPHHQHHTYQQQHQLGQFPPHSQAHHQNFIPHPHQPQQSQQPSQGPGPHPQQGHVQLGSSSDDPNILRRRFGMGVSDFVKSVVVISTLVRQLSTSNPTNTSSRITTASATTTVATTTTSSSSSTTILSTSPTAPRMRSGSMAADGGGNSSSLSTPAVANGGALSTLSSSVSTTEVSPSSTTTAAVTPSSASMSASSSFSGPNMLASPEKAAQLQNPQSYRQQQASKYPQQQQQQHQLQSQSLSQPEIFSRLVMTSVSNLTKLTKELTVRMPRSSFRDYLLSSSAGGGGNPGPGSGSGTGTGVGAGAGSGGVNGSYGFGYGPAGASILAMRKGSLI